ncbi:glycosyltransferase [Chryseosolibacter indicus]|uniref:Glycosyltransferase family 1 protein n=1 Tax=Chryseosolibacter indicus TaxID=2782351 RepID=A0ABS5VT15_9BACT|nr:hypothetical protein [Chryseosolibacter indicus]MBT1704575.1 hypothetical protein [Chryseosolibacter indicus]
MRVRIVSYEDVNAWILGKFARKLNEELNKLGVDADISNVSDPDADINHHIIYINYDEMRGSHRDTLMITHIDDIRKLKQLKRQLEVASVGVCMSKQVMDQLVIDGIPANKLCFVNPAHDGAVSIKPYTVGITSKVQPDGCKREGMLVELSAYINPAFYHFKIMGAGWDKVIKQLYDRGFNVTYYPEFNYEEYVKLIPTLDYYLYLGQDEGSMGFIDALAAGVKTIVTPQGYHLDAENGIVHSFNTIEELVNILAHLTQEKQMLINSIAHWTWKDYAIKHIELWSYLLGSRELKSKYKDGLNSLLFKNNNNADSVIKTDKLLRTYTLYHGAWKRTIYKIKRIKNVQDFKNKVKALIKRNLF